MTIEIIPIAGIRCELGEGLHWDTVRQCLWGVDIQGRRVWRWNAGGEGIGLDRWARSTEPSRANELSGSGGCSGSSRSSRSSRSIISPTGLGRAPALTELTTWDVAQRVGWVLPIEGELDHVLLGLQEGVAYVDVATMTIRQWLARPFSHPSLRLNDAKADASGALWFGSLNNDHENQSDGCLYRLGVDGDLVTVDIGYKVANGPAIDATGKIFMHTDSGRRTIYRFDLDVAAGTLSDRRVWKVFTEAEGYPDGMCFDSEGCLWVAHWGGSCISRFAMDGTLLVRVGLPTSHITNVCFGGEGLDRLFVSSARVGLTDEQLASEPYAGCLFEVVGHGVRGLPSLPARSHG